MPGSGPWQEVGVAPSVSTAGMCSRRVSHKETLSLPSSDTGKTLEGEDIEAYLTLLHFGPIIDTVKHSRMLYGGTGDIWITK